MVNPMALPLRSILVELNAPVHDGAAAPGDRYADCGHRASRLGASGTSFDAGGSFVPDTELKEISCTQPYWTVLMCEDAAEY